MVRVGFWFGFGTAVVYCFVFVVLVVAFCWVWGGIGLCTIGCGFRVLFLGFADMFGLVFCFSVFAVDARYCFVGAVVVCCWIVLPFMVAACFWVVLLGFCLLGYLVCVCLSLGCVSLAVFTRLIVLFFSLWLAYDLVNLC